MTYGTWSSWTLRIGNKAFKEVRPKSLHLRKKKAIRRVAGFWIFSKFERYETGEWEIVFSYDNGPITATINTTIQFDNKKEAEAWFYSTYYTIFIPEHEVPRAPKARKPKSKKSHLALVENKI